MEAADFSGYATKAGLKCSDGRTITAQAFQHMSGVQVPLVWQHGHGSPENILGHAVLEARGDGVYAYGFFNDTNSGIAAKKLVAHGDIKHLSIYANKLVERAQQVLHGMIKEVSLVLSGANPGALIDFVAVQHSDGEVVELDDEAVIHTGIEFELLIPEEEFEHAEDDTIEDVVDSMNEQQKNVLHYLVGIALEQGGTVAQSEEPEKVEETEEKTEEKTEEPKEEVLTHQEGSTIVTKNVFDQAGVTQGEKHTLSHSDVKSIVDRAKKVGSLSQAVEEYALKHGIDSIDTLFPDAKSVTARPEWDKRRMEWVKVVLNGVSHTPFSRIKTLSADLTLEEARAKGYIKGNLKKEQFFAVQKRTTGPKTIYKKQKLDRDDIIDITDFDVVAWLKEEIRFMLEEEIARAILLGDGREVDDVDKITDPAGATSGDGIRSILNDDDFYAGTINVNVSDASSSYTEVIDAIITARRFWKGTGTPVLFTTEIHIARFLTLRDADNHLMYQDLDQVARALRVGAIIPVEPMEEYDDLFGIIVNLGDYNVGTDKGGEINFFDDFDIDYNQFKYLMETRMSGALTKIRSALILRSVSGAGGLVTPAAPEQDGDEVTVVNTTGAVYKIGNFSGTVTYNGSQVAVNDTVTASFPIVLADGAQVTVYATPASTYYFANNVEDEWTFDYEA